MTDLTSSFPVRITRETVCADQLMLKAAEDLRNEEIIEAGDKTVTFTKEEFASGLAKTVFIDCQPVDGSFDFASGAPPNSKPTDAVGSFQVSTDSGERILSAFGFSFTFAQLSDLNTPAELRNFFFGGNDRITGGEARDLLRGFAGDDQLSGGLSDDRLEGSSGNDGLFGGAGADSLLGGTGNDNCGGDDGNDSVDGGRGDDSLGGGLGNDVLIGGIGNDVLSGGVGRDVMTGGRGMDNFVCGCWPTATRADLQRRAAMSLPISNMAWTI